MKSPPEDEEEGQVEGQVKQVLLPVDKIWSRVVARDEDPDSWYETGIGMYLTCALLAAVLEGIIIGCLWFFETQFVSVVVGMIWFAATCYAIITYWDAEYARQVYVGCMLVAGLAAFVGCLSGGWFLREYWMYQPGHTAVGIAAHTDAQLFPHANVFHFAQNTYVKKSLTGVLARAPADVYCAAPVLGMDPVPQDAVIYWAVDRNCCSGVSAKTVQAGCASWHDDASVLTMLTKAKAQGKLTDGNKLPKTQGAHPTSDFMVGERLQGDYSWYNLAKAKADEWNDFPSSSNAVLLNMMTKKQHLDKQSARFTTALLCLALSPPLWPGLIALVAIIRWMALLSCGTVTDAPFQDGR